MELIFQENKSAKFDSTGNPSLHFAVGENKFHLNCSQIGCLMLVLDYIQTLITDILNNKQINFSSHLGAGKYVTVNSPYQCVNIRQWSTTENGEKPRPTLEGISIKFKEWDRFRNFLSDIEALPGMFDLLKPCYMTHDTYLSTLTCLECTPNNADNSFFVNF
jgi:hypothetical protein